jgi:hypothetical protein
MLTKGLKTKVLQVCLDDNYTHEAIQETLNKWLKKNPDCEIHKVDTSVFSFGGDDEMIIIIFYKKIKKNNKTDVEQNEILR